MPKQFNASILLSCENHPDAISRVNEFFVLHKLEICNLQHFVLDDQLAIRVEWNLNKKWTNSESFKVEFSEVARKLNGDVQVNFEDRTKSVGIITSTYTGSILELIHRQELTQSSEINEHQFMPLKISFLISDSNEIREFADRQGIPFFLISNDAEAKHIEKSHLEIISRYSPDIVGISRVEECFSVQFLKSISCPMLRVKLSPLASMVDDVSTHTNEDYYQLGVKLIGATARFESADVGNGVIVAQDTVRLNSSATLADINNACNDVEKSVFCQAISKVASNKVYINNKKTIIFD